MEIVRRLYEAWQRDGYGVVPELMDPDIEFVNPVYAVERGPRHGYDGFAASARSLASVYSDYRVSAVQFYDVGDRVAVRATVATRSAGRAVPIEAERGYVFDFRGGEGTPFPSVLEPAAG